MVERPLAKSATRMRCLEFEVSPTTPCYGIDESIDRTCGDRVVERDLTDGSSPKRSLTRRAQSSAACLVCRRSSQFEVGVRNRVDVRAG